MDQPLSADQFQPHIGKGFKVKDGRHELTLTSVTLRTLAAHEIGLFEHNPFTLIFAGPPRDVLPPGTYTLEIADGPSFHIHVIPILTPVASRQDYQSVFN